MRQTIVLFAIALALLQCVQGSVISRVVNYTANGEHGWPQTTLIGYISYPSDANNPLPGIVIAHDWNGRDQFEDGIAEELAKLGYIAFAYDIYGEKGTGPSHNKRLIAPFKNNRTLLLERVKLAFEQLKLNADKKLNSNKLGILGYCFGGLAVLDSARANFPGLKAAVVFHGSLNSPKDKERVDTPIRASILIFHGYNDKMIGAEIPKFESEMSARNADWQLITYSNTDHAFTVPGQPLYRKQSADRAWNATVSFLSHTFA